MKKMLTLAVMASMLALIFAVVPVYAATYGWNTTGDSLSLGTGTDSLLLRFSKNVKAQINTYVNTAITPNRCTAYAMNTYHTAGSRTMGSSSIDQKLYFQNSLAVTTPTATDPAASGTTTYFGASGWSSL